MKVNLSQKFFYNRNLFKPADNPVELPDAAVEDISDNDVIVEGSAAVKARFEELKQERLDARAFQSKDAVGKLQHRLDVLEERKGETSGKDHSKEIASLTKKVTDLAEMAEDLKKELADVRKASEAAALSFSEQIAELTEAATAQPKAPDPETTPAKTGAVSEPSKSSAKPSL